MTETGSQKERSSRALAIRLEAITSKGVGHRYSIEVPLVPFAIRSRYFMVPSVCI